MSNGFVKILGDVRLLPKLRRNLISLSLLDSNGYTYKSKNKTSKIMRDALVVMRAKLLSGLYILIGFVVWYMTINFDKMDDTII